MANRGCRGVRFTLFAAAAAVSTVVAAAGLVPAAAQATSAAAAADNGYVPGQFIAKQYTEALGRAPTEQEWAQAERYFGAAGCTASTLASLGQRVYTSGEFARLGYDHVSALLTLYRGAWNREPDPASFSYWLSMSSGKGTSGSGRGRSLQRPGVAWPQVVHDFFSSSNFDNLVPDICTGAKDAAGSSYGFGTTSALAIPTLGPGFAGTEEQLQAALNAAPAGSAVALAQRAVVVITQQLTIPAGVTLTTAGHPDPQHYANMGRLVRAGNWDGGVGGGPTVAMLRGAKFENVWVDGQRGLVQESQNRYHIVTLGGNGTTVANSVLTDTAGASNILAAGAYDGYPCTSEVIQGNLITSYTSSDYQSGAWADGVTNKCEDALIKGNTIVDASDMGVVSFMTKPAPQRSIVTHNTIIQAGSSSWGGIGTEPWASTCSGTVCDPPLPYQVDFRGTSFDHNTLWTSPNTHFVIALVVGSRAWHGPASWTGIGGSWVDNTTGTLSARVDTGIAASGQLDVDVSGNSMRWTEVPDTVGACPHVPVAASVSAGTASGTIPRHYLDTTFDNCIIASGPQ